MFSTERSQDDMVEPQQIHRHKAAMKRYDYSKPVKCLFRDLMITKDRTVFDYGSGRGDDLEALAEDGIRCDGFDPEFRPNASPQPADVVNLGYVLNVIEDQVERRETLVKAWHLTTQVLCVAARVVMGEMSGREVEYGDGLVTSIGTFQKYFSQAELREYIESVLSEEAHPAAPGIFYVFRDDELKSQFLSNRVRRTIAAPRKRVAEIQFEKNLDILQPLIETVVSLGRLPDPEEFDLTAKCAERLGSVKRAFAIIRKVTGDESWVEVGKARTEDLSVYLALSRFGKRPKLNSLSKRLQRDIKAFFGSYKKACEEADESLFAAGDADNINEACVASPVGRLTSNALWLHRDAVPHLSPLLRIYEGCARAYLGSMDDMLIVKLHRFSGKVSYLSCPDFENKPHPEITSTVKLSLRSLRLDYYDSTETRDKLVLDQKEKMVAEDHADRAKFERLSKQEWKHGVLDPETDILRSSHWTARLDTLGFKLRGHRLVRKQPNV